MNGPGAWSRRALRLPVLLALAALLATTGAGAAESPLRVEGATRVDPTEAKALFDRGAVFVDVRKGIDWEAGRIPHAVHLELADRFNEAALNAIVAPDEPVVFYCNGANCPRSSIAARRAVLWGYSRVYYFREGFPAWTRAGYPVE